MNLNESHLPNVLRLHPDDNVAVALVDVAEGTAIFGVGVDAVRAAGDIQICHKVSLRAIEVGADIRKYGQFIGKAKHAIQAGEHVHDHNLQPQL